MNAAIETVDTAPAPPGDDDHERECVEEVFGLHGELSGQPWEPWEPSQLQPTAWDFEYASEGSKQVSFPYWYDGVPDGGEDRLREDGYSKYESGVSYLTVVTCALFGGPPEVLREKDPWKPLSREWRLVFTWQSSGERECPGQHEDDGPEVTGDQRLDAYGDCVLCGEAVGTDHGYIYLGDGWVEAVYRSEDPSEPLGDGFDVGTVVWWKKRLDDNWTQYIVAAGPAPEDYEGMLVAVYEDEDDDDGTDDAPYIDAEDYEEVKKSP